ncbi:MAG: FadR/GntR family transcriptional regulator [Acidimicrobiales bacterium]
MATARSSASASDGTVVELIQAHISQAPAAPDGRLPTERELAEQLGLTRTAVRRGLASLEAEGRISREVGRGTFLRWYPAGVSSRFDQGFDGELGGSFDGPQGPRPGPRPDDVGPADVMAVRRLVEPQVIPLVVAWATNRELQAMERCLARGRTAGSHEEFETWDAALHRTIAAGSHNRLFMRIFAVIESARHGPLWGDLKRRSYSRERRDEYQQDHEKLVAALRVRDVDGATRAMREHLWRVERNMMGAAGDQGAGPRQLDPTAGLGRPGRP